MELCIPIATLSGDPTWYVALNRPCRLVDVTSVVQTAVTTNDVTVTLSDGTTTIGTVTVAAGSAAAAVDGFTWAANVELGPSLPLKIVCSGTPGAGTIVLTLTFSEYHVA